MLWQIRSFPKCDYHVFLSHSQEDRGPFIEPTRRLLAAGNILSWFDQDDYYYGRPSRTALRDGILRSRHTVLFITDSMIASPRGWCVMELTLVELLQSNLHVRGGQLAHPILPLFFVPQEDERLPRSVWQGLRDQGRFCPFVQSKRRSEWAANQIVTFLIREQRLSTEVAAALRNDDELSHEVDAVKGLRDRVADFHPASLSIA